MIVASECKPPVDAILEVDTCDQTYALDLQGDASDRFRKSKVVRQGTTEFI